MRGEGHSGDAQDALCTEGTKVSLRTADVAESFADLFTATLAAAALGIHGRPASAPHGAFGRHVAFAPSPASRWQDAGATRVSVYPPHRPSLWRTLQADGQRTPASAEAATGDDPPGIADL